MDGSGMGSSRIFPTNGTYMGLGLSPMKMKKEKGSHVERKEMTMCRSHRFLGFALVWTLCQSSFRDIVASNFSAI